MIRISVILFFCFINCNAQEGKVIYLQNDNFRVGVLPDVGGRIVYLSYQGSDNLIKSDSSLWNEPDSQRIEPGPDAPFKAYNGHIVWVGPQSEWWKHQDIKPERAKQSTYWPPDPWLIYGDYRIQSQTDTELVLLGPRSPVSGLRMVKTLRLEDDEGLYFEVEAFNTRQTAVSWDLWLNTRLDGFARSFVPVKDKSYIRVMEREANKMEYAVCEGYFYYLTESPGKDQQQRNSKAFISPSENWMAAFTGEHCLRIIFPDTTSVGVHPEQGRVEVYNATFRDPSGNLTELEYHSNYRTLQPGESMKTWQRWEVLPYKGKNDDVGSYMKFLDRKFRPGN